MIVEEFWNLETVLQADLCYKSSIILVAHNVYKSIWQLALRFNSFFFFFNSRYSLLSQLQWHL